MTRANCRYHRLTEVQLAASNVRVCISMKPDVTRGPAASDPAPARSYLPTAVTRLSVTFTSTVSPGTSVWSTKCPSRETVWRALRTCFHAIY